jgi:hypothetical protein
MERTYHRERKNLTADYADDTSPKLENLAADYADDTDQKGLAERSPTSP